MHTAPANTNTRRYAASVLYDGAYCRVLALQVKRLHGDHLSRALGRVVRERESPVGRPQYIGVRGVANIEQADHGELEWGVVVQYMVCWRGGSERIVPGCTIAVCG
jgi:hypothetical protein